MFLSSLIHKKNRYNRKPFFLSKAAFGKLENSQLYLLVMLGLSEAGISLVAAIPVFHLVGHYLHHRHTPCWMFCNPLQ